MGQQSEIFAKYRSLFNSKNVKPPEDENSQRLDNLSFIDFLFELVKSTRGKKEFKNVILKGSLSKIKKTSEINTHIKKVLTKQYGCDSVLIIQPKHTTKSNIGLTVDKSSIDVFGLLGFDPDSGIGKYMYEGNDVQKHVNYAIYKAQGYTESNKLSFKHNDIVLFELFANSPNTLSFKFGEYYANKQFSVWLGDYLAATEPNFNFVNFTTILTDIITGAVSIKGKKNLVEFKEHNATIKALTKIFGFCSEEATDQINDSANNILNKSINTSLSTGDGFIPKDYGFGGSSSVANNTDPFFFTPDELVEIDNNANLRSRGVVRFETCGDLDVDFDPDLILNDLERLFDNANQEPFYTYDDEQRIVENSSSSTNYDNDIKNSDINATTNFFDEALKNGLINIINKGESDLAFNMGDMSSELQLDILKAIPYALMQLVLSPKTLLVSNLFNQITNNNDKEVTGRDFIREMTPSIQEIGGVVTDLLIKNIFDTVVSDLKKNGRDLAINFLKQRGLDYTATLTSILELLKLLKHDEASCGGVLSKLLTLLKFGNFGPMPMLPPPLVLLGGALKPGLNSVAIVNDLKSNLTKRGIETAPILPDGSPNNIMIALEETIKTLITSIKTESSVQVFGIGATGPVQGYGQIQ